MSPVDPHAEAFGLEGHVVVMDDAFRRLDRGVVYVNAGVIVDVVPTDAPPPAGLEQAPVVN
ncbi:MAG: hypothetical protein ACRDHC_10635, partial [Actinomycetota bacterium]